MVLENEGISIIIPCFNNELYIEDCIYSVLNQTFKNWELILINDGSTDNTYDICNKLKLLDNRIKFISYPDNKGVSHARNLGIEESIGKYIFFLDSDDMIHYRLLEEMYHQAESSHADLVISNKHRPNEMRNEVDVFKSRNYNYQWQIIKGKELIDWWIFETNQVKAGIGGKLFLKSFIGSLRFEECIYWGEDTLFNYLYITKNSKCISYILDKAYYYRSWEGEAVYQFPYKHFEDILHVYNKMVESELNSGRKENAIFIESSKIGSIRNWYMNVYEKGKCDEVKQIISKERESLLFKEISLKNKFLFDFCLCNPPLYKYLRNIKKRIIKNE
ncbi:MAG: glycosyltransferase family 2 protein [Erysipelotrichaceae bacterium]|nr:glycosyltransferase family 2 protein [Erysipelotrichaceae bacterium]